MYCKYAPLEPITLNDDEERAKSLEQRGLPVDLTQRQLVVCVCIIKPKKRYWNLVTIYKIWTSTRRRAHRTAWPFVSVTHSSSLKAWIPLINPEATTTIVPPETSSSDFSPTGTDAYVDLFLRSAFIFDWPIMIIKRGMAVAGRLFEDPSIHRRCTGSGNERWGSSRGSVDAITSNPLYS
jgi:hypothetical protein